MFGHFTASDKINKITESSANKEYLYLSKTSMYEVLQIDKLIETNDKSPNQEIDRMIDFFNILHKDESIVP